MRALASILALLLTPTPAGASLLDVPHPGRIEARTLAARAEDALRRGDSAAGAADLRRAVALDPLLLPAWVNLSVAESRRCHPRAARAAALVALRLEPGRPEALAALRRARTIDCEPSDEAAATEPALAAIAPEGERPPKWESAAAAFRERGEWLLAALCTEQIDESAGPDARALIAGDLARASLFRAAIRVAGLEAAAAGEWIRKLRQLEPRAESLADRASMRTGEERGVGSLAQILEVMLAGGDDDETVLARLYSLLGTDRPRPLRTGWLSLQLPPPWFVVESETGDEGPELLLRRAPGDAQIAFYGLGASDQGSPPSVVASRFAGQALSVEGGWQACGTGPDPALCARAEATIDLGPEGRGAVQMWRLSGGSPRQTVLALELPADGGCGESCARVVRDEAEQILTRAEVGPDPPPSAGADTAVLPVPACWRAPRNHGEMIDAWRNYALGDGLLTDLPPGLVVTTVGGRPIFERLPRSSRLWFRGGFSDREGTHVRVGDAERAGWVAVDDPAPPEKALGVSTRVLRRVSLDETLRELGQEGSGVALRIEEAGFSGEWLVIDRSLEGHLVRFAWPLAEGAESVSPLYAALSVRGDGPSSLPPLVDLSSLFAVQFDRFPTRERRADPREGRLQAAELEFFVPRGFHVSLRSSSSDGFPLSLTHPESGSRISVSRWSGGASRQALRDRAALEEGGPPPDGWREGRARRGGIILSATWPAAQGEGERTAERFVVLLVPADDPQRASFRLRIERGAASDQRDWASACSLLAGARYTRRSRK